MISQSSADSTRLRRRGPGGDWKLLSCPRRSEERSPRHRPCWVAKHRGEESRRCKAFRLIHKPCTCCLRSGWLTTSRGYNEGSLHFTTPAQQQPTGMPERRSGRRVQGFSSWSRKQWPRVQAQYLKGVILVISAVGAVMLRLCRTSTHKNGPSNRSNAWKALGRNGLW